MGASTRGRDRFRGLVGYLPAILFATGPIVNGTALYYRATIIDPEQLVRALGAVMAAVAILAVTLHLLPGNDRVKAASLALAVAFTCIYPSVATRLHVRPYGASDIALASAYALLIAVVLIGLIWKCPEALGGSVPVLSVIAAVFAAYLVWFCLGVTSRPPVLLDAANPGGPPVTLSRDSPSPDIVHVIFDGLGRLDYLESDCGVSAAGTRRDLAARGVAVADDAVANYSQTYLSVAAMLSLGYLDGVHAHALPRTDRVALGEIINQSTVIRALVNRGYRFTLLSSGYEVLEHHPAAVDGIVGPMALGDYETYLFRRSAFRMFPIGQWTYGAHRARTRRIIDELLALLPGPEPRYVLAHLLLPHPPFVFGPSGEAVTPPGIFMVGDASAYAGSPEDYRARYCDQARFALATIERLAAAYATRPRPTLLIVNGDHGSGLRYSLDKPLTGRLSARMAPFIGLDGLRSTSGLPASPVNIYRVVFNEVFHTQLPILTDRSFVSPFQAPFDFHEVHVPRAEDAADR